MCIGDLNACMLKVKVLSWHLLGGTEGNYERLQSGQLTYRLRFENGTSKI
jgi:hypothetical protein